MGKAEANKGGNGSAIFSNTVQFLALIVALITLAASIFYQTYENKNQAEKNRELLQRTGDIARYQAVSIVVPLLRDSFNGNMQSKALADYLINKVIQKDQRSMILEIAEKGFNQIVNEANADTAGVQPPPVALSNSFDSLLDTLFKGDPLSDDVILEIQASLTQTSGAERERNFTRLFSRINKNKSEILARSYSLMILSRLDAKILKEQKAIISPVISDILNWDEMTYAIGPQTRGWIAKIEDKINSN
jgi:hypothetical protein